MKKSLVALAVLAVSGAAFAQSSVTLYGVADMSVGKTNRAGLGSVDNEFKAFSANSLNNGTSRFGFRGVEDLGGGLKAGFNFEGGLSLADGTGNFSGGQLFSRAANVSLMGGFGEIRGGRTVTTSFHSVAAWELTGTANYSVVANQFGFNGFGSRDSAVVMYNSPDFGGIKLSASTVLKGNDVSTAAGLQNKYDLSATYAAGPLTVSGAYAKIQNNNEGFVLGGKYNFGAFQVAGSYNNYETDAGAILNKGFTIGASTAMGPVVLTVDIARDTEFKDTDLLLEAKYALSKRTFVYGAVMRDGKGKFTTLSTTQRNGKTANYDATGYSVGVRHNF
jgi:predicted porin